MAEEHTEPVAPFVPDDKLPTLALIIDAIEMSHQGRNIEAIGALAAALRTDPPFTLGATVGIMRQGVENTAHFMGKSFAEIITMVRQRAAS